MSRVDNFKCEGVGFKELRMALKSLRAGVFAVVFLSMVQVGALDVDALKKEVERIREEIKHQDDPALAPVSKLDTNMLDKYGPNDSVKTRVGALGITGLVQIWYQTIQNDSRGIVVPTASNNLGGLGLPGGNVTGPVPEPNGVLDNDTFRVRRTELRFAMDLTDNISAFVMIDPSREANTTFTPVAANPNHNAVFNNPHLSDGSGRQLGNGINPQILQDAFISFHDLIPHHDFQIGQFKPPSGEEAWRASGLLDFVDRSMVTAINNVRDIGVMAHGTWFYSKKGDSSTGRLQYWVGAFNGPNGTVLTDPEIIEGGNRSDDNYAKDFCWRIAGQPIWDAEKWTGRLEIGAPHVLTDTEASPAIRSTLSISSTAPTAPSPPSIASPLGFGTDRAVQRSVGGCAANGVPGVIATRKQHSEAKTAPHFSVSANLHPRPSLRPVGSSQPVTNSRSRAG